MAAFMVKENCVVPGVDVEKHPEPVHEIEAITCRTVVVLLPSLLIVTATTAPEVSEVPEVGEKVPYALEKVTV
jgi:hypothetical protein